MKQVLQKLKDGVIEVLDVPVPFPGRNEIVVRNVYSSISPGTEGSTVAAAKASLVGKAMARPQQVKQVLDSVIDNGLQQTRRAVDKRLNNYSALGYSCAGIVVEVGAGINDVAVGDYVACAGVGVANHAEFVVVPQNLYVKLPSGDHLEEASVNALGAIALQGIRHIGSGYGGSVAVVGYGIIGQLTAEILNAFGFSVSIFEVDENKRQIAEKAQHGKFYSLSEEARALDILRRQTELPGYDAVIICAYSDDNGPINLAGRLSRKNGKVVIVGVIGTNFQRDPDYYRKEIEIVTSCSYGPGRYDLSYEDASVKYPIEFVRWTETQNMMVFQRLVAERKINVGQFISHTFDVGRAREAYEIIHKKSELFGVINLKYPTDSKIEKIINIVQPSTRKSDRIVGIIGAGNYPQTQILPHFKKFPGVSVKYLCTKRGNTGLYSAKNVSAEKLITDPRLIFDDPDVSDVMIFTRHDQHSDLALHALKAGKNVYLEKPLFIKDAEYDQWKDYLKDGVNNKLFIGYNRSYSDALEKAKAIIRGKKFTLNYNVVAGKLPRDHWLLSPEFGGGRIVGEVCHFIHFALALSGTNIEKLNFYKTDEMVYDEGHISICMQLGCGSLANINYVCQDIPGEYKESIDIYASGAHINIADFSIFSSNVNGKKLNKRATKDKGQSQMLAAFFDNGEAWQHQDLEKNISIAHWCLQMQL